MDAIIIQELRNILAEIKGIRLDMAVQAVESGQQGPIDFEDIIKEAALNIAYKQMLKQGEVI